VAFTPRAPRPIVVVTVTPLDVAGTRERKRPRRRPPRPAQHARLAPPEESIMKRLSLIVFAGLLVGGLAACGGGSPTTPSPPSSPSPSPTPSPVPSPAPEPPPPTPQGPFEQTLDGTVGADAEANHRVVIPRDGTATFTLIWNDAAVDLDLGLTPDSCTDILADTCVHLADTNGVGVTHESLVWPVHAGETYRLWAINFALVAQGYTLQIRIQ
jgi:hypothetical protein